MIATRSIYTSPHTLLRVKVRSALIRRHPTTGDVIETVPGVYAEFGIAGAEQAFHNQLTGEMDTSADIRGGVYDLDAIGEDKIERGEWTQEIVDMVRRRLDQLAADRPQMLQRVDFVTAPAPAPWPTYDNLADEEQIVGLARDLGLVSATISYERENKDRSSLVAALESALASHPDPEPAPEPVVALPPEPRADKPRTRTVV